MKSGMAGARTKLAILLAILSTGAVAAPVTFDFSGKVTSATGAYSSLNPATPGSGATINGTLTFDYALAMPALSAGTVGAQTLWHLGDYGGATYGTTAPTNFLLVSSMSVGSFTYLTQAPAPYETYSFIQAGAGGYQASEIVATDAVNFSSSALQLHPPAGGVVSMYDSAGLPQLSPGGNGTGSFETMVNGAASVVNFNFLALTNTAAVPEPGSPGLLLGGLGLTAFLARRRRIR